MAFAYGNNGQSYRGFDETRPDIFQLGPGEILFDTQPTVAQLTEAFPGYAGAVAAEALQAEAATAQAAGMQLVSTSTPALNGTYAIDSATLAAGANLMAYINAGKVPGGGATFHYPDISGAAHGFTGPQFLEAWGAAMEYVYALNQVAMGVSTALPAQPVTIP